MENRENPPPPNGFLTEDEPMLKIKIKEEITQNNDTTSSTQNRASPKKEHKVIQCVVLLLILALIALLCSVFIKPELYFTDYGKQMYFCHVTFWSNFDVVLQNKDGIFIQF